jgi:hypothetical protein
MLSSWNRRTSHITAKARIYDMHDMDGYTYITKDYFNKATGYLSICKSPKHQSAPKLQTQS